MKATKQEISDFFFKEEQRLKNKIDLNSKDSLQEFIDTENILKQIKGSFLETFFKRT